jgi:hypothetical protein
MQQITGITTRGPDQVWSVENGSISPHDKSCCGIKNYIDLVQTVLFVNKYFIENQENLSEKDIKQISSVLLKQANKASNHLEQQNWLCCLIVKVILYIYTGTTLNQAIDDCTQTVFETMHIKNDFSADIHHPQLMEDARKALESPEAYLEIGKKYTVPEEIIHKPKNPILFFLRNAVVEHWLQARELIMQGKDFKDWRLNYHCDTTMQIGKILMQLAITRELELLDSREWERKFYGNGNPNDDVGECNKPKEYGNQGNYTIWIHILFSLFYQWVHAIPTYDPTDNIWYTAIQRGSPQEMKSFYIEGTRQNDWRESFNEIMTLLESTLTPEGIKKMLKQEPRMTTGLDTEEMLNPDYLSAHPDLQKHHIARSIRWTIHDDDLIHQRLIYK